MESFGQRLEHWAGLAILIIVVSLPVGWVVVYAALYSVGGIGLLSEGWTLDHWRSVITAGGLIDSLVFSISLAFVVTTTSTITALLYVLWSPRQRRSPLVFTALAIPLGTPGVVMAIMTNQILSPGGFLARVLFHADAIDSPSQFPVLVHDPLAVGIVATQICGALPLLILFLLKTWTAAHIDRYCRLAESMGASRRQARFQIALPMLLRRVRVLVLLNFLFVLGSYEVPLLLGRQSPQVFSVLTQRHLGRYNLAERPEAFVLATTYLVMAGAGVYCVLRWRHAHH